MKKIIKKLFSMLFLAVVFVAFSLPVFANSPPPADHLTIQFEKLPSDVAYADLLIKFKKNDKNYTELNKDNLNLYGFDENCRIVLYNEDGFESFTFHYEKAKSEIKPDKNSWNREVSFCKGIEYREYLTQYEDLLSNYNRIKIAFLDEHGDIISVSKEIELPQKGKLVNFYGYVLYEYQSGRASIKADRIGPIFFAAIIAGFLIIVSVGLEVFVAILFKFSGKQIAIIAGINTLTQVIMRLLYFILPLPHLISTVILETLVYISEFIVFRKMNIMKDESTAKILCYVILANTLSLILGIKLLNWVD